MLYLHQGKYEIAALQATEATLKCWLTTCSGYVPDYQYQ